MLVRVLKDEETHSNIHWETFFFYVNAKTQHNDHTRFKNLKGFDMAL